MNAIANILREAADKIAALELPATLATPASAVPEPPDGFHKAMMGPLKVQAEKPTSDILMWQDGIWKDLRWNGNSTIPYALRIGSEIARLNGLELKLELGRTYATNAGEIVTVFDACIGRIWNEVGQALIDGVAQPLDHLDSIREEIPAELLPLPKLPDGFKELRWRGFEWTTNHDVQFYFFGPGNCWLGGPSMSQKAKGKSGYYLEAIPADKEPDPAKPARREFRLFDDGNWNHIGGTSPMDRTTRVREVLPGDPSPKQVEALVKAAENACRNFAHNGLEIALQPFTGKESE